MDSTPWPLSGLSALEAAGRPPAPGPSLSLQGDLSPLTTVPTGPSLSPHPAPDCVLGFGLSASPLTASVF